MLLAGAAAAPATAAPDFQPRPLVEPVEGLNGSDGIFLSVDSSTLYSLSSWDDGQIVDVASREVTGTFPAIESLTYADFRPSRAVGPTYAVTSHAGYSLLTLATGAHESFVLDNRPGEAWEPMLEHVVASADGNVTAITQGGEFLALDGATVTDAQRIRDTEAWPHRTGISADGSLYFEAYTDYDDPVQHTMTVIDMATGETILNKVLGDDDAVFTPAAFDVSDTSIWGTEEGDPTTLVQLDLATGAELSRATVGEFSDWSLLPDAAQEWFVTGTMPAAGGTLATGAQLGARDLTCCISTFVRLPDNGDVIYYDLEMRQVGFVTAPTITNPADATVTALGETVQFTSEAEGLALSEDEIGAVTGPGPDPTIGSIWQSSVDGTTWEALPGETGATLAVEATADTYPLQYRRHFFDPFWGGKKSSAPARMIGLGPEITRADDLPKGTAGASYPGQTITAKGQPGMTLSSTDLPATLTLNPATGELTGTTDVAGDYEFTVTVTDAFGTDSKLFHLSVAKGGAIVPPIDPPGPDPEPKPEPAPPVVPTLPETGGGNWVPAATLGAALLVAGAAGVIVSRRRSHSAAGAAE